MSEAEIGVSRSSEGISRLADLDPVEDGQNLASTMHDVLAARVLAEQPSLPKMNWSASLPEKARVPRVRGVVPALRTVKVTGAPQTPGSRVTTPNRCRLGTTEISVSAAERPVVRTIVSVNDWDFGPEPLR